MTEFPAAFVAPPQGFSEPAAAPAGAPRDTLAEAAPAPGLAEAPAAFLLDGPAAAPLGRGHPAGIPNPLIALGYMAPAEAVPEPAPTLPLALAGPGPGPAVKRALDLCLGALALALAAPLMAAIAGLLALEGGPVLFVQRRVGRDRRRFACLKFRTMLPDAEARLAALLAADPAAQRQWRVHQKLASDPRITWLGRFLRASSLDELPQLVNVLRGEMSLVGPRPIIAPEVSGYPHDRDYYASPLFAEYATCRPGITGLWQVSGRHRTSYGERIRLDRRYVREWTVLTDLRILARTVRVVLARSGG